MYKFGLKEPIYYGLVVYGVYSFTNYLLFNNYPLSLVIKDTMWGCLLCYLTKYLYLNLN